MQELPLPYLKEVASQLIFISAFLGGFTATILGTLILAKSERKMLKYLIIGASFSAINFIVVVFSMTQVYISSLADSPLELETETSRLIGVLAFFMGILSLMFVLSASGWMHSKKVGIATTVFGVIGLILIFMSM